MIEVSDRDDRRGRVGERRQQAGELSRTMVRLSAKSQQEDESEIALLGHFEEIDGITITLLQRDLYTRMHVTHVNRLAGEWIRSMPADLSGVRTAEEADVFLQAALLHDVGKVVVRDELLKAPRKLTAQEYAEMQLHVEYGERLLAPYPRLRRVREIVAQHHEWFNGDGYPRRLAGDEIDPLARALSVLDAFSAMTVDRPYHVGIADNLAIAELRRFAGTQFDPEFVESFAQIRGL